MDLIDDNSTLSGQKQTQTNRRLNNKTIQKTYKKLNSVHYSKYCTHCTSLVVCVNQVLTSQMKMLLIRSNQLVGAITITLRRLFLPRT